MSKNELPRGIRRRGNSLIVCFALADGTIERRSLGECSISYAKEQLHIFRRQVREGNYEKRQPRPKPSKVVRVSDLLEPYLRQYRNKGQRAEDRQRLAWKYLAPIFAATPVADITTDLIERYIESRRLPDMDKAAWLKRNGTINRELAMLKAMLSYGTRITPRRVEQLPSFPQRLQESPARSGFIGDREYDILARSAKPLWLRALIACAYTFGFRKSELLNLRVEQLDLLERWIVLRDGETKNGEGRKVRMSEEVYRLLAACVAGKKADSYVFTHDDGTRVIDPRDDWAALCVACGLGRMDPAVRKNGEHFQTYRGLNLHDFRRSAIRVMVRRGISETVAMKISGHKTSDVFRRYDITSDADLTDATRKIEQGRITGTQTDTPTFDSASQSPQVTRI